MFDFNHLMGITDAGQMASVFSLFKVGNLVPAFNNISLHPVLLDTIPGLSTDYLSQDAQNILIDLFKVLRKESLKFYKVLLLINLGITLVYPEKYSMGDVARQFALSFALLLGFSFIFGNVLQLGFGFADKIIEEEKVQELQKAYGKNAEMLRDSQEVKEAVKDEPWYKKILGIINQYRFGLGQPAVVVMLLSYIGFITVTGVMNLLWLLLVVILFVTSPLMIVLSAVLGVGPRIASNWFGALVQLALLKVWLAICAFMINLATIIFITTKDVAVVDLTTTYGATTANIVFIALYLLGPVLVGKFFPFGSNIVTGVTQGLAAAAFVAVNQVKSFIPKPF